MATTETTTMQVKGTYTTAEITDIQKSIRMDGRSYLRNHILMKLSGHEGIVRQFHDEVTKPNLDRCIGLAKKMNIGIPFPTKLEERENAIKQKLGGAVAGTLTAGETIAETYENVRAQIKFYASSMTYAKHDEIRDCFRRCFEAASDFLPRIEQALKETDQYYPAPTAKEVELVGARTESRQ